MRLSGRRLQSFDCLILRNVKPFRRSGPLSHTSFEIFKHSRDGQPGVAETPEGTV